MKVIIIGGVAGGASCAARLRRLDERCEIIMVERGGYISYANCGLPYYVGGEITEQSALTLQTPESFHARFNVDVRVMCECTGIDPAAKTVTLLDRKTDRTVVETYDRLVLSPGAEPLRLSMPGMEDARVFTLRTIPDTLNIRAFVEEKAPKRALVIGGGYIGCEMAENLQNAGLSVSIAELGEHVIAPLDLDTAADVHNYLRQKGLTLHLKSGVTALYPKAECIQAEINGELFDFDMVVSSVGVRPESQVAKAAGIQLSPKGAVLVDSRMRTSAPDIYAVGDCVEVRHFVSMEPAFIPLAGPANKQGRIAADNICGIESQYKGTQGSAVLKLFDMTVATTGLNEAQARALKLDVDKALLFPASHATYYPGATNMNLKVLFEQKTGRLLGAQIVGFDGVEKRCDVLATAIRAGLTAVELTELELCYAPPFSSAKDPVNMAGYMIENLLSGKVRQHHWHDVFALQEKKEALLDVRTKQEYQNGHIEGAVNIPLDELRERVGEVPRDGTVYVNCQSGLRSYVACRILMQNDISCSNLGGGYRQYAAVMKDREACSLEG